MHILNPAPLQMPSINRRRLLLINNPVAGMRGRTLIDQVVAELEKRGAHITRSPPGQEAMRAAVQDAAGNFDAIIAAGGDGTVRALAAALEGADVPIALVPMGTGNVLASETDLPRQPMRLADLIIDGRVQHITGGRANGQPFYLMAGAGFDGAAVAGLNTPWKRRMGKLAYAGPGLRALSRKPPRLDVIIDGKSYPANWAVFANGQRYGGPFTLTRRADLRTQGLQAVLINAPSRLALAAMVARLAAGSLDQVSGVEVVACTRASVHSPEPVPVQVDGDPFGVTPLEIESGGSGFSLIVPEGYAR